MDISIYVCESKTFNNPYLHRLYINLIQDTETRLNINSPDKKLLFFSLKSTNFCGLPLRDDIIADFKKTNGITNKTLHINIECR